VDFDAVLKPLSNLYFSLSRNSGRITKNNWVCRWKSKDRAPKKGRVWANALSSEKCLGF